MQQKLSKLWQKEVKIARFCSVIKDIPPLNVGDSLPKLPFIQENVVMRWDWFQHLGSNSKTLEKMTEEELSNKEDSESQTFTKLLTQKDPTKVVQFLNRLTGRVSLWNVVNSDYIYQSAKSEEMIPVLLNWFDSPGIPDYLKTQLAMDTRYLECTKIILSQFTTGASRCAY